MLPVVRELVSRGDDVRFYSFDEFREKIEKTGAAFVSCEDYLPSLTGCWLPIPGSACGRSLWLHRLGEK